MGLDALPGYLPKELEGCGDAIEGAARTARTSRRDVRVRQRRVRERLLCVSFGLRSRW